MLDEIKDTLKEIRHDLGEVRETQIRIEEDLKHHIKRSDRLEELVEKHEIGTDSRLKPLEKTQTILKFVGALIPTAGVLVGILSRIGLI